MEMDELMERVLTAPWCQDRMRAYGQLVAMYKERLDPGFYAALAIGEWYSHGAYAFKWIEENLEDVWTIMISEAVKYLERMTYKDGFRPIYLEEATKEARVIGDIMRSNLILEGGEKVDYRIYSSLYPIKMGGRETSEIKELSVFASLAKDLEWVINKGPETSMLGLMYLHMRARMRPDEAVEKINDLIKKITRTQGERTNVRDYMRFLKLNRT